MFILRNFLQVKIYGILIFTFILTAIFVNPVTEHHDFEIKQNTIKVDNQSQFKNDNRLSYLSSMNDHEPPCSEHGHEHCCQHLLHNNFDKYSSKIKKSQKDFYYAKHIFYLQFKKDFLKPPIA